MMQSSTLAHILRHNVANRGKKRFHLHAKTLLARVARELGLETSQRNIRSCMGGPAVMGEAILHTDDVYVMVHERGVMFRTCNGRKDYTGDQNQNRGFDVLADPHAFALQLRGFVVAKIASAQ